MDPALVPSPMPAVYEFDSRYRSISPTVYNGDQGDSNDSRSAVSGFCDLVNKWEERGGYWI